MTWLRSFSMAAMVAVLYVAYDVVTGHVTTETWLSVTLFLCIGAIVAAGVAVFERRARPR